MYQSLYQNPSGIGHLPRQRPRGASLEYDSLCGVPGAHSLSLVPPGPLCALGYPLAIRSRPSIRVVPARFRTKGQGRALAPRITGSNLQWRADQGGKLVRFGASDARAQFYFLSPPLYEAGLQPHLLDRSWKRLWCSHRAENVGRPSKGGSQNHLGCPDWRARNRSCLGLQIPQSRLRQRCPRSERLLYQRRRDAGCVKQKAAPDSKKGIRVFSSIHTSRSSASLGNSPDDWRVGFICFPLSVWTHESLTARVTYACRNARGNPKIRLRPGLRSPRLRRSYSLASQTFCDGHGFLFPSSFSMESKKKNLSASAETAAGPQTAAKGPVKMFLLDDVSASVFARTQAVRDGERTFYSVSFSRSYRDSMGKRRYVKTFNLEDLAKVVTVAQQADDYIRGLLAHGLRA